MAKKIVLLFCAIMSLFFNFTPAASAEDSIGKIKETAANLESIEKLPIAEDIGLIAKTIRNAEETYRSVKAKFWSIVDYGRKIVQTTREILGKIENGGIRIRNYIRDKIGFLSKEYEINLLLI